MCCLTLPPIIMGSVEKLGSFKVSNNYFPFIYIGGSSVFMMGERGSSIICSLVHFGGEIETLGSN